MGGKVNFLVFLWFEEAREVLERKRFFLGLGGEGVVRGRVVYLFSFEFGNWRGFFDLLLECIIIVNILIRLCGK